MNPPEEEWPKGLLLTRAGRRIMLLRLARDLVKENPDIDREELSRLLVEANDRIEVTDA